VYRLLRRLKRSDRRSADDQATNDLADDDWQVTPEDLSIDLPELNKRLRLISWSYATMRARLHELDGEFDAAEPYYRAAVRVEPAFASDGFNQGRVSEINLIKFLRRRRRFDDAERAASGLIKALEERPPLPGLQTWPPRSYVLGEALSQRARIAQQTGELARAPELLQAAITAYSEALQSHPDAWEALESRGIAALNLAIGAFRATDRAAAAALARSALGDFADVVKLDGGSTALAPSRAKAGYLLGVCAKDPDSRLLAARHVAAQADPDRATLALKWLREAIAAGRDVDFASDDFAPLRNQPGFEKLGSDRD